MVKTRKYFIEFSPGTKEKIASDLVAQYAPECKIALDAHDFLQLMSAQDENLCITELLSDTVDSLFDSPEKITIGKKVIIILNAKEDLSFPISDIRPISKYAGTLPKDTELVWGVGVNKNIPENYQLVIITNKKN